MNYVVPLPPSQQRIRMHSHMEQECVLVCVEFHARARGKILKQAGQFRAALSGLCILVEPLASDTLFTEDLDFSVYSLLHTLHHTERLGK